MTQQEAQPPSAVVWDWRRSASESGEAAARERAAARRRGLLQALVGLAAAALIWWLWKSAVAATVVAGIALVTLLLALAFPTTAYRRLSRALETFGHAVGMAVTWVLMTLLYLVLFLPVGLLLRAGHKLGITTAFDRRLPSYWSAPMSPARTLDSYRKQF